MFVYPTEPPKYPVVDSLKRKKLYSTIVMSCIIALAVLFGVAGLLLLTGQFGVAAFVAFLELLFGLVLGVVAIDRMARADVLERKLQDFDEIKNELIHGVGKWNGLETNLSNVLRDEKEKLQTEYTALRHDLENKIIKIDEREREVESILRNGKDQIQKEYAALSRELKIQVANHEQAVQIVTEKYIRELTKWTLKSVTPRNFASSKTRIEKAIAFCRSRGGFISNEAEEAVYRDLKSAYEEVVRKEAAKAEQQRIKQQIREEEKARAEIDKELRAIEAQRNAIQMALDDALAKTHEEHNAEVEELLRQLAEAEAKSARTISLAQQTKAGHVYVISNIGSFGTDIYKIGMTRRLEPLDRVKELGDASVPFGFDVHMMISCNDAPKLENALHRSLHRRRINKVNFRKEFFRVTLDEVRQFVEANHGKVEYIAEPEALEYNEGLNMELDDLEFVETVLGAYENDSEE